MIDGLMEWVRGHDALLWWLGAASLVMFVGTLIVVPLLVARIPVDYFAHRHRHRTETEARHPVLVILLALGKNLLGAVFVAAGLVMLLIPGQGVLTVLIGLMLVDFPGKYRLERWLVTRAPVRRSIDWLRTRAGRPPLTVDIVEDDDAHP